MLFVNWQRKHGLGFLGLLLFVGLAYPFYIHVALDPPVLRSEDISMASHILLWHDDQLLPSDQQSANSIRFSSEPQTSR